MEILKILEESANDLIPEDLDFFETELDTGGPYKAAYKAQCRTKIKQIRKWMSGDDSATDEVVVDEADTVDADNNEAVSGGIVLDMADVVPDGIKVEAPSLTPVQRVQADVKSLRERTDYKSAFKKYAKASTIIDANFLDKNFSLFDSWEMDAIVSVKQLGEEFLEKYFGAIDHDKIARYQLFSENFFMKHFSQMDENIVLESGKNEWRKKENRSKQLDVFLRLKGVKI